MAMTYRYKHKKNDVVYNSVSNNYNDDSDQDILLQPQPRRETPTLDYEIEADDTLQAIALRFHCTIAELKRINNILRDNEIFARRSIRIPVRPHSVLTELIVGVHVSGNSSPTKSVDNSQLIDIDVQALEEKLKSNSANCEKCDINGSLNEIILNSKVNSSVGEENEILEYQENDQLLQQTIENTSVTSNLWSFSGDDCGLSWVVLVIFVLFIGFICPLIYVLYIAEHPEEFHQH